MYFSHCLCVSHVRVLHWLLDMLTHRNMCALWLLLLLHVAGGALNISLFSESIRQEHVRVKAKRNAYNFSFKVMNAKELLIMYCSFYTGDYLNVFIASAVMALVNMLHPCLHTAMTEPKVGEAFGSVDVCHEGKQGRATEKVPLYFCLSHTRGQ